MKKILFIVDHKHRDLSSNALIGYFLNRFGFQVKFCAVWREEHIVKDFKPDCIVLPKPIYHDHVFAKWRINNIKILVLDVEGNLQSKEKGFLIPKIFPDVYFYWNDKIFDLQKKFFEEKSDIFTGNVPQMITLGCPRLDFHHSRLRDIFETKEKIKENYKIPLNKKIITIATASGSAGQKMEDKKIIQENLNRRNSAPPNYFLESKNYEDLREKTLEIILKLNKNYKNTYHVVLKPHPNEAIQFWEKFILDNKIKNITLIKGDSINNLLYISDVHISHNVCTSTFESMLHKIPSIEIHGPLSKTTCSEIDLKLPLFTLNKSNEIDKILQLIFEDYLSSSKESFKKANNFCKKYYGDFDGNRCLDHARFIESFMRKKHLNLNIFKKAAIFYKFIFLKWLIDFKNKFKNFSIKKLINKLKGIPNYDIDSVSNKIDGRGRFDKLMSEGEEKIWLQKFSKIKL
jgi:surface carbohydrate biosynthesis protein